jgi:solute carrier family 35 protein F1/2
MVFGMIVSGFQLVVLESEEFAAIDWNLDAVTSFMAFALSSLAFSSLMPWLLRVKGSTMFNLSLLTSNMWAVAVQALGFHKPVDGLYFVALGLVGAGLLLYSSAGEPSHPPELSFLESAPELKYTLIAPVDRVSTV